MNDLQNVIIQKMFTFALNLLLIFMKGIEVKTIMLKLYEIEINLNRQPILFTILWFMIIFIFFIS